MTHDHIRINGCYQCVLPNVTDEIEPLNMHGHANTWEEELQEVCAERDALRAEIERLTTWKDQLVEQNRHLLDENAKLQREKQAMLEQMDIQLHMNRLVANRVIEHNADTCQHKDCSGA
jgi:predicted nuclease with TOPRIM domain